MRTVSGFGRSFSLSRLTDVRSADRLVLVAVLASLSWLFSGCDALPGPVEQAAAPISGEARSAASARDSGLSLFASLPTVMAHFQLGKVLDESQVGSIATFVTSPTGDIYSAYIARPELPKSCAATPAPDPS